MCILKMSLAFVLNFPCLAISALLLTFRRPAVGHPLNFDEVRLADVHQLCVVVHLICVPPLDQRQPVHCPLALLFQFRKALRYRHLCKIVEFRVPNLQSKSN
jgi:hypothetical protein